MPPLSGFYSKDEILTAALHSDKFLFGIEYLVAGITAFYMFRLYFNIFWGKEPDYSTKPHEAPATMTIPLILLAIGTVFAGYIPFNKLVTSDGKAFASHIELAVAIPSILIGLFGIGLAFVMYKNKTSIPDKIASTFKNLYKWIYNKFYIDEIYLYITKNIIFKYISAPIAWFDRHIIDGTMNAAASVAQSVSFAIRRFQSGQLQQYAVVFIGGAIALAIMLVYFWI
jgi:NADH-quinone oxidoreductase subunit L